MNELSLFTGAGGGVLGTQHLLGWRCLGYVEYEGYCQEVLKARIRDGVLRDAPIFGDIREFISSGCAEAYRGMVDVISAGFPCQPFSVAGKKRGADDERNMWPATIECVRRIRPRFFFGENVPGLLGSGYFGRVLGDLAACGYNAKWRMLSAAELGACHFRNRIWIVASNANDRAASEGARADSMGRSWRQPCQEDAAKILAGRNDQRAQESGIRRVAYGLAYQLDRLAAIGNGQVPLVAATAWRLLADAGV